MHNPYAQVALTYVRSPFSTAKLGAAFVGTCLIMILIPLVFCQLENDRNTMLMEFPPFLCLFVFLTVHVKEQFVDSRAHLMPGFRRIHAAVAGTAALLSAVVVPAAFASLTGWDPIGFIAVTVLLFGVVMWIVLSMSVWLFCLVCIAGLLLANAPDGTMYVHQLVCGDLKYDAVTILAIGVAVTLVGAIRLVRLNEDMPQYRWIKWNSTAGRAEFIGRQVRRESAARRLLYWLCDRHIAVLTRHAHRAATSRWSRSCRWQVGMVTGWLAFFVCFLPLSGFLLMTWIFDGHFVFVEAPSAIFSVALPPGIVVATLWRRRISVLPQQSLMCVDRATYLKQVGMAAAISQLQIWLSVSVGLAIWWQWSGQGLHSSRAEYVLWFLALCQPFFFGLTVWLLRFRSPIPIIAGYLVFFQLAAQALFFIDLRQAEQAPTLLGITAIFAVLGLILTWDAYRRWLVTDFD